MDKRLLSACLSLPLIAGCAAPDLFFAAPPPLRKAPVQDADAILQTLTTASKPRATSLAQLGVRLREPPPGWVARLGAPRAEPAPPLDAATAPEAPAETAPPMMAGAPPQPPAPAPAQTAEATPAQRAQAPVAVAAVLPPSAPVTIAVPPVAKPLPLEQPVARAADEGDVLQTIEAWRTAWERGDAARYLRFYDASFKGDARSRAEWEKQRAARLANGDIKLAFYQVKVDLRGTGEADVHFVQAYSSGRYSDHGEKRMKLRHDGAGWKIVAEAWTPR